jgi:hypothetical protein
VRKLRITGCRILAAFIANRLFRQQTKGKKHSRFSIDIQDSEKKKAIILE